MNTKLYIGSEQADFSEAFNVQFSIGDIRNLSFGNANKSFTLDIPHSRKNLRLLKHIQQPDVTSEPNVKGWLFDGEQLIIFGNIKITGYGDHSTKVIIDADEWIDSKKDVKLSALDFSASDHALSVVNVENSWSASYPVYRYPMIDFGALQSGETGSTAKWWPTDFIPMISVKSIIEKIIAPYTISSTWLSSTFIKDLFILGREVIADEVFLKNKKLTASIVGVADNDQTDTLGAGVPFTAGESWIPIMTASTDEGSDFVSNQYTIPETGTYRFSLTLTAKSNEALLSGLTITNRLFQISIVNGATVLATTSITTSFAGQTLTITTPPVHCVASDVVNAYVSILTEGSSAHGSDQDLIYGLSAGTFENYWGALNRYPGVGKTIELESYLPDMTQLDFLAAIRDIFNTRFFTDKRRQVVYPEPWDQLLSSTVIDLNDYVDHEDHPAELISPSYNKNIVFRWRNDESDAAYKDYLKYNTDGPGKKELTLSSIYAKNDIGYIDHPFSSIVTGYNFTIGNLTLLMPRIFNEMPILPFNMFDRKTGFNTRIVEWKGLTAGLTWNYDGTTKNTYPKIQGLDWASLYTTYWMKFFHYVDKGKLYTIRMKVKPGMLSQFLTIVSSAQNEGFRPVYLVTIKGIQNYFFLQKITSDGNIAELELILKS